jgi:hypothetical protein
MAALVAGEEIPQAQRAAKAREAIEIESVDPGLSVADFGSVQVGNDRGALRFFGFGHVS